ncbi:hypothetical protein [Streptomyces sp. NPDC090057]|uniref:hypothetical protein n=1 Tax=Streptomyces sp. NPDC090057 TaxID=3365935 RepID=UPI0037FDC621
MRHRGLDGDGPDRAWAEYGEHLPHEAWTYASWRSGGTRSAATTVRCLRAEGVDRIPAAEQCAEGD